MLFRLIQIVIDMVSHIAQAVAGQAPEKAPEEPSAMATETASTGEVNETVPSQVTVTTNSGHRSRGGHPKSRVTTVPRHRDTGPRHRDNNRDRQERKKEQPPESEATLEHVQRELEKAKKDWRAERASFLAIAAERDRLRIELSEKNNALEQERRLRASKEALLATRTTELEAAHSFLPATETITDTHIMGLVRDLNYEISQVATILAEAYENVPRSKALEVHLSAQPDLQATMRLLTLPPNSAIDATTALQIGLQAALVNNAAGFLRHGIYQEAKEFRPVLAAIKEKEDEHIANRWSALAHQYRRFVAEDHSAQRLLHRSADLLRNALGIAGYDDGADPTTAAERVLQQAGDPLLGVARLLIDLDVILGEKVSIGWMESFNVASGSPFNEFMEASYQGDKSTGAERVVLCTALGLRRTVKGKTTILLKPMVALSSLFPVSAPPPGLMRPAAAPKSS